MLSTSTNSFQAGDNQAFLIDESWYSEWESQVFSTTVSILNTIPPINNSRLLSGNHISDRIEEGVHFRVLCPAVWRQLFSWFGGGPEIPIPVCVSPHGALITPSRFFSLIIQKGVERRCIPTHNLKSLSDLEKDIQRQFGIPTHIPIRLLWRKAPIAPDTPLITFAGFQQEPLIVELLSAADSVAAHSYSPSLNLDSMVFQKAEEPGMVGLDNLGNTCFFNAAVQCLMHTKCLMDYFLSRQWESEVNRNGAGLLCTAFASLARRIWSGQTNMVRPDDLKKAVGKYAPQFQGVAQQDAHELLTFVLDGLHGDLNRSRVKLASEPIWGNGTNDGEVAQQAWERHKQRNDSVIVDLFHGQLRSKLDCPTCGVTSTVFDPYMSLQLPLVRPRVRSVVLIFVPFSLGERYQRLEVNLTGDFRPDDVVSDAIGRRVRVALAKCSRSAMGAANYSFGLDEDEMVTDYFAIEVPHPSRKYVVGRVRGIDGDLTGPILAEVPDLPHPSVLVQQLFQERLRELFADDAAEGYHAGLEAYRSQCCVVEREWRPGENVYLEFTSPGSTNRLISSQLAKLQIYPFLGNKVVHLYLNPRTVGAAWVRVFDAYRQWQVGGGDLAAAQRVRLSIAQCFLNLSAEETLDESNQWHCPICRKYVQATKKMDVWRVAPIVVLHLKRFIGGKAHPTRKFSGTVEFPEVLDMRPFCLGPQAQQPLCYRLFAVCEHSGGLSGGHYMAHAKVWSLKPGGKGSWCVFNDAMVSRARESDVHSDGAYILFYEKVEE